MGISLDLILFLPLLFFSWCIIFIKIVTFSSEGCSPEALIIAIPNSLVSDFGVLRNFI